ncbi:hypothetical protein [Hymenobacter yonginensis]|uniref:STAS/SEC14 domain-containing protein n=1 Tax=Hymenobacter yonginensis TaxID=748197 RepID=A0ABY7PLX3_9BACT|nr:hypothetical protein [Hymenobacter yonginensis]WBO83709.1 hypothetical protein O9Z63_15165 [Hymenobacter yonginensis]
MTFSANLQLHYRPDLGMLTARWLGESELGQLQQEYGAVQQELVAHGTRRLLLDIRRRDTPNAAATQWFSQVWLPDLKARMAPATLRLAYLISPLRAEQLRADSAAALNLERAAAEGQSHALDLFYDEGEAVRWLLADTLA